MEGGRPQDRRSDERRVEDGRGARRERERDLSPPPHVKARLLAESRKPVVLTGGSQFAPQPYRALEAFVLSSPFRVVF